MIPQKKHPKKQLEKYSIIFMQISLVLVLFIVHVLIENIIAEKRIAIVQKPYEMDGLFDNLPIDVIRLEKPPQKQTKIPAQEPKSFDKIKKGNPPKLILPKVKPTLKVTPTNNYTNTPKENIAKAKPIPTPSYYNYKMVVPLFKGCKDLSLEENRACFDKKMKNFINKKFDISLAENLGLPKGNYKIYAQFIINEKGEITDVQVRAPHKKLHKEVQKIIHKLPQFTPGKVGDKNVKVRYLLPINFKVD
ncbi:energy transducer TonB [Pseudotenacibaculum sp. MALMAid0570]|uniref:energy transducer TonB n=1 Tax=Pseudotenacibaculum sp. MALMAid0570 TaxID=3143938 RepID=UPI0032DF8A30